MNGSIEVHHRAHGANSDRLSGVVTSAANMLQHPVDWGVRGGGGLVVG